MKINIKRYRYFPNAKFSKGIFLVKEYETPLLNAKSKYY